MGDSPRIGSGLVGTVHTNPLYGAEAAKPKGALRDGTTVEQGPAQTPPTRNTAAGNAVGTFFRSAWQEVKSFLSGLFTRPAAAAPDTGPAASTASCDAAYAMVTQDCAKLNDLPQFMRNQQIAGINDARGPVYAVAKDFAAGLTKPASVYAYDGAVDKKRMEAQQVGETFREPPARERDAVAKRTAENLERYLQTMIGGLDADRIQAKADRVPQALCDTVATALRALDDHLEANNLTDTDLARKAKQSLVGKLLGNRLIAPALAQAKADLDADALRTAQDRLPEGVSKASAQPSAKAETRSANLRQMNQMLPQMYSSNVDNSSEGTAIRGQMKHSVDEWKAAFDLFAEKVAARGADAAEAAARRAGG